MIRRAMLGAALGAAISIPFGLELLNTERTGIVGYWELQTVDWRFRSAPAAGRASSEVVVVQVDEGTIQSLEREEGESWPAGRWFWEELVGSLHAMGAKAIVLDVTFQDQKESARLAGGDPFEALCPDGDPSCAGRQSNLSFGQRLHAARNAVVGVTGLNAHLALEGATRDLERGWHPAVDPFFRASLVPVKADVPLPSIAGPKGTTKVLRLPEANILAGTRAIGVVDYEYEGVDADGVVRHVAPAIAIDGVSYVDLGVAGYAASIAPVYDAPAWQEPRPPAPDGRPPLPALHVQKGSVRIGESSIRVRDGVAWLRWRGKWLEDPDLRLRVVSAWPVIKSLPALELGPDSPTPPLVDRALFEGKIVLVGLTYQGEYSDLLGTPFGPQPGVFKHATTIDTILTGEWLRDLPPWADALIVALLSVFAGMMVLGIPHFGWTTDLVTQSVGKLLPSLALTGAYGAMAMIAFRYGWVLNIAHALAAALVSILASFAIALTFLRKEHDAERKKREEYHGMLKRAFSPEVAAELLSQTGTGTGGIQSLFGGKRMELTLYFSDIAGFTTISEKLPPEALITILNEYLTRVTELLSVKHRGQVDKYIGDAVMAFWGAPLPAQDGPVRACLAALDAMREIEAYSKELVARGLSPLKTRIGINTGMAVAGWIGHPDKIAYTALGDTVNLASRLEGANKAYGTYCMLGPETYEAAKHVVLARELDLVKVKGKNIPVRVYELMGLLADAPEAARTLKNRYEAALARYRAGDFTGALADFEAIARELGDGASKALAARCVERIAAPPEPGWDGSNELHEK